MSYFSSTVGRKQIVGICGLGLSFFILTHMLGNLLVFLGPEAYNQYGHALTSNKLIYIAEAGLLALIFAHIIFSVVLTIRNKKARPQKYAVTPTGEKKTNFAAKTMIYQGVVILVFIVHHLLTFKFGEEYEVEHGGVVMRDLYRLMAEVFSNPLYVVWYIIAVIILWTHVGHGFSSSFKSLGFNHPKYTPRIDKAGVVYAAIVCLGFIAQPLYMFMKN